MNKRLSQLISVLVSVVVMSCVSKQIQAQIKYNWTQSSLGGGGFITGLIQDYNNPNIIYARCDVAGVFKSTDRGESWRIINKGLTKGYHHNLRSFCISRHNPKILFRCSGEYRAGKFRGSVHKSVDAGESWQLCLDNISYLGNGGTRTYGELVDTDPFEKNDVIVGSFKDGIRISHDVGKTWKYIGLKGEPLSFVAYHPFHKGYIYAGAFNSLHFAKGITKEEYDFAKGGKLFLSKDGGKTWEKLCTDNTEYTDIKFHPTQPNTLYVLNLGKGVLKSTDNGITLTPIMNGLPSNTRYRAFAINKKNPDEMYTVALKRPKSFGSFGYDGIPDIPIFVTRNGGENWSPLSNYSPADFSEYPSYLSFEGVGWDIPRFIIDAKDTSIMYMSNWFGVSKSIDGGKTWKGHYYKGLETTCVDNIVADPTVAGKVYMFCPDHLPSVSIDTGKTFVQYSFPGSGHHNSTSLVASRFKPNIILYAVKSDWYGSQSTIVKSDDNGKTFRNVKEFKDSLTIHALRESYHTPGTFYAYIDRALDKGAGLYKSIDWGETWQRMNTTLPGYIKSLPFKGEFIEDEVLSVTVGQRKNATGTNKLLCLDPFKEGTIYFGEWTEGLYMAQDDGKNWIDISKGLPFHKSEASILMDIKADEKQQGVLYAGFLKEGIWKTTNYGKSWEKIFPKNNMEINASAIVVDGNMVAFAGESSPWSNSPSVVYLSNDKGKTWTSIYNNEFGALRWKGLDIDKATGILYGSSVGNGVFYGIKKK